MKNPFAHFDEYVIKYYRDAHGRFTRRPRRIKLPYFFRVSRGYDVYATSGRESPDHFKIIGSNISPHNPIDVRKLDKWMDKRLDEYFLEQGYERWWQQNAKSYEMQQVGRDEISPHKLFRTYLYIDDELYATEDMY